ncbi:MAG TPA: hypothetical protein VLC12_10540 [Terriglobales bacterium]|nr:hypothetical protein [Terriglobales bacterium]
MNKLLAGILSLLALAGCSSQPSKTAETPAKPAPKQAELSTGRMAFQRLYIAAHGWAPDARAYQITSQLTKESIGHGGKAGVWRAGFASATRRAIKPYIWSGLDADDAPSPGISPGVEDSYNPANTSTQAFDIGFLKVDSDKAFEVAQKHGGDKLLQKNPQQPVVYICSWNPRENELIWHVIYGTGPDDARLRIAVSATTGEFLRVEK